MYYSNLIQVSLILEFAVADNNSALNTSSDNNPDDSSARKRKSI